jgi:DNA (cytosine-5)-methyltransferase 1
VFKEEKSAGKAILEYFSEQNTQDTISLCKAIEPTIMLQRMFSKVMELYDNQIIISEFSRENGLIAVATSMAIIDYIEAILKAPDNGYIIDKGVLSAADFGVPQKRLRYVVMGVRKTISKSVHLPTGTLDEEKYITVHDAISDIENVDTFIDVSDDENGVELDSIAQSLSSLGMSLRDTDILYNHVSTNTTPKALERFKKIKQGDNFHSLDAGLKTNYSDPTRTQNTIYLRLKYDEPSGTVVNVRKSMWIHPVLNRALSIREAARLQTFPDSFVFSGTKDAQYQQVGNAVPPILAKAIAEHLCGYLGDA